MKVGDLTDEDLPGRLVLEHDVVLALEGDQSGAGDVRR